jgi:hypothetical protein
MVLKNATELLNLVAISHKSSPLISFLSKALRDLVRTDDKKREWMPLNLQATYKLKYVNNFSPSMEIFFVFYLN